MAGLRLESGQHGEARDHCIGANARLRSQLVSYCRCTVTRGPAHACRRDRPDLVFSMAHRSESDSLRYWNCKGSMSNYMLGTR
jgi:hypothetical protein